MAWPDGMLAAPTASAVMAPSATAIVLTMVPHLSSDISSSFYILTPEGKSGVPGMDGVRLRLCAQPGFGAYFGVDDGTGPLPAGDPRDLLGRAPFEGLLRLFAVPRDMRRQDRVGGAPQRMIGGHRLVLEHVQPCPGETAFAHRGGERDGVDNGASRRVDDDRAALHQAQLGFAEEMPRLLVERRVARHKIRLPQQGLVVDEDGAGV